MHLSLVSSKCDLRTYIQTHTPQGIQKKLALICGTVPRV